MRLSKRSKRSIIAYTNQPTRSGAADGLHGCGGLKSGRRNLAMRVLLQQKNSGLYVRADGVWTGSVLEAYDFLSSSQAIDYCLVRRLSGLQLVLKFDEQNHDIVLQMAARSRSSA